MSLRSFFTLRLPMGFAAMGLALIAGASIASAQEGDGLGQDLTPQEQLQALLEAASEQFNEGDFETAAATYTRVITALEASSIPQAGPYVLRAKTYANLEEYEAALEDLKLALQYGASQPALTPEIQNTRAEIYMELQAWQAALPDLQAATQANRANPQYQFNLGKTLVKLGGAAQAEKPLTRYLDAEIEQEIEDGSLDWQRAEAYALRAEAFTALRKEDEAKEDIAASLAIDPDQHEPHAVRAQLALIDEDYEGAAAQLAEAISRYEPEDEEDELPYVEGMLLRASAFEEAGKELLRDDKAPAAANRFALCRDQCDELLDALDDADPRTPQIQAAAYFRKGVAERMLGELADAVKSFTLAIEVNPAFGEAYFRRGICFHFLGEERLAIRDFETASAINFDSPRSNLWKGMSWAKLGDYNEAIRAYGESIAVSDRYTPAFVNRGLAHLAQGDYEKAIEDLNEAIRIDPTEALHYYRRGKAYSAAGERDKAIRSLMNAVEFDGELRPAYTALVAELRADGQAALANEYASRAASL